MATRESNNSESNDSDSQPGASGSSNSLTGDLGTSTRRPPQKEKSTEVANVEPVVCNSDVAVLAQVFGTENLHKLRDVLRRNNGVLSKAVQELEKEKREVKPLRSEELEDSVRAAVKRKS